LDGDQLHFRHSDEVAEVGGVVESMPVTYLDCRDADRHGVLFMDARSLRAFSSAVRAILHEFASALEGQTGHSWTRRDFNPACVALRIKRASVNGAITADNTYSRRLPRGETAMLQHFKAQMRYGLFVPAAQSPI
jgi:hypothetical protein